MKKNQKAAKRPLTIAPEVIRYLVRDQYRHVVAGDGQAPETQANFNNGCSRSK